jgi:acetyl-CoA C-acetyltransferase
VLGAGWSSGSPTLESRVWGEADYVRRAAERAYGTAGIDDPHGTIDLAEVDDTCAFKELQHLEALGLAATEDLASLVEDGELEPDGDLPVNVSGGSLGQGDLFEANGLVRALECVEQLRGEAGERQVEDVALALAQSWRGAPTTSGAVLVLGVEEGGA